MTVKRKFVYVIWRDDGSHKIGISNNPESRMRTLMQCSGHMMLLAHTVSRPTDARPIEREAHRKLRRYALGGEWFQVDEDTAVKAVSEACWEADRHAIQHARLNKLDELKAAAGREFSRREIVRMELDGVFGETWADVRRKQGWEERLARPEPPPPPPSPPISMKQMFAEFNLWAAANPAEFEALLKGSSNAQS